MGPTVDDHNIKKIETWSIGCVIYKKYELMNETEFKNE